MAIRDASPVPVPAGEGIEDLLRRHAGEAYAFALRLTRDPAEAEELAQEGLVKAFRAFDGFRGESGFRPWLFQILVNRHRDRIRERQRDERHRAPVEEPSAPDADGTAELEALVRRKIDELPPRQREVLLLHTYHGLDYRAIAAALGCSYEDIKVNLSLARKKLREGLKEHL